jgi:hypothetical protein
MEKRIPTQQEALKEAKSMSETTLTTYLPEIECQSREGDAEWEVLVAVTDEKGRKQHLSVGKGMVTKSAGKNYLTVGIVQVDYQHQRVLVELPREADSGVTRLWVPFTSFRRGD